MILINLLPHREAARKRRKEAFQATMFASFLVGLAIAGAVYWWFAAGRHLWAGAVRGGCVGGSR